jgi:uncharacterized protein YbaR (Trm112 family)
MAKKTLLERLACPACDERPALNLYNEDWLNCKICNRYYPLKDGIPFMLPEEATMEEPKGNG